ncbi:cytochrome b5-like heme/steroid binding domain-containing protein [Aspergillus minisclerotigenes]|uniref:Cytochrome b5-like heme/steroid binding domain-containing protein n=1 Tax=Aspergillus minisclerotigenes TaxID=656917 RepID=A0A5N6JEQ1_9EURO|nr:cytochrome b5-like heme/steroid binding domain-containing protein [Aspergillus minisclerotigenes]
MSFIFPSVVPGLLWGDWLGGFIYAGVIRLFFCYQAIFSINSIAHWLGDQSYDDRHTPRNHTLVALLCFGEGYHNYHHEFPADYRNGVEWYQCDVTKWCIWVWKQLGLAYGLKQAPDNVVGKGTYQQARKELERKSNKLDWGLPLSQLPGITWDGFQEAVKDGRQLIILSGMVYDIATFIPLHPGGVKILVNHIGKDATKAFNGEIYSHSTAARNWLDEFRVGFLCGNGQKLSHVPIPAADQDSKGKRL